MKLLSKVWKCQKNQKRLFVHKSHRILFPDHSDMSGSENVLEDGFRFQLTLQPGLGCLTQPLRKQLLESEVSVVKHNEELDRRIQQNALLWPCQGASSQPEKDQNDK